MMRKEMKASHTLISLLQSCDDQSLTLSVQKLVKKTWLIGQEIFTFKRTRLGLAVAFFTHALNFIGLNIQ